MKPAPLKHIPVNSVHEACSVLHEYGDEAKILAGGQSLMPMLNFRILTPTVLVDINPISFMAGFDIDATGVRIGASTRHWHLETDETLAATLPIFTMVMPHVAHLAIRNRGTIGGSVAHADPAAELPLVCMLLDASIEIQSSRDSRQVSATDFFVDTLTTSLEPDEMVTGIFIPAPPESHPAHVASTSTVSRGTAFEEIARRHGDFALVAVAAEVTLENDTIVSSRIAVGGAASTPLRLPAVEHALQGQTPSPSLLDQVAGLTSELVDPYDDLHASSAFRRHLSRVLVKRVLHAAIEEARAKTREAGPTP